MVRVFTPGRIFTSFYSRGARGGVYLVMLRSKGRAYGKMVMNALTGRVGLSNHRHSRWGVCFTQKKKPTGGWAVDTEGRFHMSEQNGSRRMSERQEFSSYHGGEQ